MSYREGLIDGWQKGSRATTKMAPAPPVRRGTSAVAVTADAWAALYPQGQGMQSTYPVDQDPGLISIRLPVT